MADIKAPGADSFFTEIENQTLDKNLNILNRVVDKMVEGDVPTDNRDIRVLKEVIEAIDNKVTERAKLRLKLQENATAESNAEMAAELLKQIASRKQEASQYIPTNAEREIPTDLVEKVEIVPGELEINPPTLTLDDLEDA